MIRSKEVVVRALKVSAAVVVLGWMHGCTSNQPADDADDSSLSGAPGTTGGAGTGGKGASSGGGSPSGGGDGAPTGEPLEGVKRIEVVDYRACALLEDGHVWCWGLDENGELGDGEPSDSPSFRAQEVPGLEGVTELGMAGDSACAVLSAGGLVCWGSDLRVDFAGNSPPLLTPTVIPDASDAIWVRITPFLNGHKACILDTEDRIVCWHPDGAVPREPVICQLEIEEMPSVGLALKKSGSAIAFSEGLDDDCNIYDLPELEGASALSRGTGLTGDGVCGLIDGKVLCSANINYGSDDLIEVTEIDLPRPAIALDKSSGDRRCALLEDEELWCWAGTALTLTGMGAPRLELAGDIVDFGVSGFGGCAVLGDTTVKCWGQNSQGQRGSDAKDSDPPSLVLR